MTRILIAGVGYRHLRDHSFGVVLTDALAAREWPPHVAIEDLSYNPIAVVQRLQDDAPAERFDLAIFVGAAPQAGRAPGTLAVHRWDRLLPEPDRIHSAITEAVTGIISLDNTVIIGGHFAVLPPTVVIVELEPAAHEWGDDLTPLAAAALERADALVTQLAFEPSMAQRLPDGPVLHERPRHTGVVFEQMWNAPTRVQ